MRKTPVTILILLAGGPAFAGYVEDRAAAVKRERGGKYAAALDAWTRMAGDDVTEFQKSDALERAAACARRLKHYDRAAALAARIPIPAVAKTAAMQNLVAQRQYTEVVKQFGDEKIEAWPFWKAGEALFARGRAFCAVGKGAAAEKDLVAALSLTTDDLEQAGIRLVIGRNREEHLADGNGALEAYRAIVEMDRHHGNARYFRGLLAAARLLRKQKKYAAAEIVLDKVDVAELRGWWRAAMLIGRGDLLAERGRRDAAIAAYREVLEDTTAHRSHREAARAGIAALEKVEKEGAAHAAGEGAEE